MKKKIIIITSIILTILAVAASSVYALWYISANKVINPADVTSDVVKGYIKAECDKTNNYNGNYQLPLSSKLDNSKLTYSYKLTTDTSYSSATFDSSNNTASNGPIDAGTYNIQVSYTNISGGTETLTFDYGINQVTIDVSKLTVETVVRGGKTETNVIDSGNQIFDDVRGYNVTLAFSSTSDLTVSSYTSTISLSCAENEDVINNYILSTTSKTLDIPDVIAYINTTTNTYSKIELALTDAVSGNIVVVIPPSDEAKYLGVLNTTATAAAGISFTEYATESVEYHISEDCTIKEGVSLIMPYDSSDAATAVSNLSSYITTMRSGIYETYGASNFTNSSTSGIIYNFHTNLATSHKEIFLRTKIIVDANVEIINNGNLIVNGMVAGGQGASSYNGQTAYYYSELCLSSGAKITNNNSNANIYAFGYITESTRNNSSNIVNNYGSIYLPFVLRDYRGVASSYAIYDNSMNSTYQMSPFNQMEFRNIEPTVISYYNGKLIGIVNIHDRLGQNDIDVSNREINLVGNTSASFIYFTNENAYCITKYNNSTQILDADFYGGFTLTKVVIEISITVEVGSVNMPYDMNLSTENAFFPISYRMDVSLNSINNESAIYDCTQQDIKVMTGGSLYIGTNATIKIDKLINYSAFADRKTPNNLGTIYAGGATYDNRKKGGKIVVAGTIEASSLAGDIIYYDSATINNTTSTVTAYEFISYKTNGALYTTSIRLVLNEKLQLTKYEDSISKIPIYIGVNKYDTLSYTPGFTVHTTDSNIGDYVCTDGYQTVLWVEQGTTYTVELLNNIYNVYTIFSSSTSTTTQLSRTTSYNASTNYSMLTIVSTNSISSNNNGINEFDVQNITITGDSNELYTGTIKQLTGTIVDIDKCYSKTYTWSSSDTSIATVDQTGLVSGVSEGNAVIYLTCGDVTGSYNINVVDLTEALVNIESVTITCSNHNKGDTIKDGNYTYGITINPSNADIYSITWTIASVTGQKDSYYFKDSSGNQVTTITGQNSVTMSYNGGIRANSNIGADPDDVTIKVSIVDKAGNEASDTFKVTVDNASSCITGDTLILMADYTYKEVRDLQVGDKVICFDHETGQLITTIIMANTHYGNAKISKEIVYVLTFENGETLKVVMEHGIYDLTLNKYVMINEDTYLDYVGHEFAYLNADNNTFEAVKLIKATKGIMEIDVYSPDTLYHLNCFANNFLAFPGDLPGFYNQFTFDDTLKYDEELMQQDIEEYGLLSYEELCEIIELPYEVYEAFPLKYYKIAIAKGLTTYDELKRIVDAYLEEFLENYQ